MRIHNRLNVVVGAALALLAALISTSGLLGAIGRGGIPLGDPLRQGAVLFKLGLIVLGLYIVVLGAVPLDLRPRMRDERTGVAEARWTAWGVLLAILVTCALLCFHRLDDGLWFDEIVTYVRYARLPFGHIVSTYDEENQHVLYSLLAHASFLTMGESAWALRLPAVLLGIGSVWALFMVGRLVGSVREALLSSALLAFSYPLIWFSQDARGYTGLLFLTLLSSPPPKFLRPQFFLCALYWCQYRVQFVRRDWDLDTIRAVVSLDHEHQRRVCDITRSARFDVAQHFLQPPINIARRRRVAQP